MAGWPETLEPVAFACDDHDELFGLDRIPAEARGAGGLTPGAEIVGEVLAGVGPMCICGWRGTARRRGPRTGGAGVVAVLDARMLSGWVLGAAEGRVTTVPVCAAAYGSAARRGSGRRDEERDGGQEGLF